MAKKPPTPTELAQELAETRQALLRTTADAAEFAISIADSWALTAAKREAMGITGRTGKFIAANLGAAYQLRMDGVTLPEPEPKPPEDESARTQA